VKDTLDRIKFERSQLTNKVYMYYTAKEDPRVVLHKEDITAYLRGFIVKNWDVLATNLGTYAVKQSDHDFDPAT